MDMSRLSHVLEPLLDLRHQQALLRRKSISLTFLALSIAAVIAQQSSLLLRTDTPNAYYRNVLNLGASYQRYFSFYYYFGGFPVNLDGQKTSTREEAEATLKERGPLLRTDLNVYNRASIFLLYPDAWWNGRPDTAEMRTGHFIWFTLGLILVLTGFWYLDMPLMGLLTALLCGSDPFQVWEVYHQGSATIFPTVISTGLVGTGLCLLLMSPAFARYRRLTLVLLAVAGAVAALQYEIRLEGVGVFFGALFALVFLFPHTLARRIGYLAFVAVVAIVVSSGMNRYFDAKLRKADEIVKSYGGSPAGTTNAYYATQWWALWSGLGDFDEKYGFLVDDRAGLSYYYGHDTTVNSERAMRADVIRTVTHDPLWFAGIIARRVKRVFVDNTPYRVGYGTHYVDLPVSSRLVTALWALLLLASVATQGKAKLGLFILPASVGMVSLGQLADYGLQFYCIVHLFVFAYVACVLLDVIVGAMRWTATRSATPPAPA